MGNRGCSSPHLPLDAGAPYTPHLPRHWLTVRRYPDDHEVFVPVEAVASSPSELPRGYTPLFQPVSNGLGAGFDTARAVSHGTLELLQRDGNSVNYRALDRGRVITLDDPLPDDVRTFLDALEAKGVRVFVKLAATDFGLVNLYVVGDDPDPVTPLMLGACGEACHPDRTVALRKALFEYGASRTRLMFDHGDLGRLASVVPDGYLAAHRAHFPPVGEEPRALRAMLGWGACSTAELRDTLAPVFCQESSVAWHDLPNPPVSSDPLADLNDRLGDLGIFYRDVTTDRARDHGVVVCKVVVPTLEVETASYGRIGMRNLTRLLDRNSPLVGLGAAPPGAEPIVLRGNDEAALGQPAWFDPAELRRTVGPLYTLYREPSRHAAQYVSHGFS
ncbi:MAG: YcaO-like family protein [Trueperaceae bacterium]|nr:YcaO-like family protein [Trueperaceae bacterium]